MEICSGLRFFIIQQIVERRETEKWGKGTHQRFRHPLYRVFALRNIHNWHARDFSDPSFEIFIASSYYVAFVHHHTADNTVIGVGSFMCTFQSLKSWILCYPKFPCQRENNVCIILLTVRQLWIVSPIFPIQPSRSPLCKVCLSFWVSELRKKYRQLGTFSVKAVHHRGNQLQLVLNGKVDKVGIHNYVIRRTKLCVVLEEQSRRRLRPKNINVSLAPHRS